jgi:uncharacterized protein (DUF1778 family)
METAVASRRDTRVDLRIDDAEKALLKEAAGLTHQSLSAFVLEAARQRAESVIAERRRTVLDDETFDAFVAALDTPADDPAVRALFATPSLFERR